MKIAVAAVIALALTGCAGLQEIAQSSIDQASNRPAASPAVAGVFVLPLPGFGTPELAKSLQDLGRGIARRARPWSQIELTIATPAEERFALAEIERGIRSTGWQPEALIYPYVVRVDPFAAPSVRVIDGLPALSPADRERLIEASRQARPL